MPNKGDEAVRPTERADALLVETLERRGDARLILVMRGLRQLSYGLLAVILGVVLAVEGFSPAAIGVLFLPSPAAAIVGTYVTCLLAHNSGPRRKLAVCSAALSHDGRAFALLTGLSLLS